MFPVIPLPALPFPQFLKQEWKPRELILPAAKKGVILNIVIQLLINLTVNMA
jgi:hypothetical protein